MVDLLAFRLESDGTVTQTLADSSTGGSLVSGITLVAQRFLVELCTEKDSVPYLSGRGCKFLSYLRNRAATETDIFSAFTASLADVRKNLQSEEDDTDPADERFSNARISNIQVASGSVNMNITITTLSKQKLNVKLPVPIRL